MPGAYCDLATLVPPQLLEPNDGGIFVLYTSHLFWAYPDATCEPEGYRAEVNTASDFSGTMFGATTTMPNSFGWPIPLNPNTPYFWRVRATVGATEGPWSAIWSFNAQPTCELSTLVAPTPLFPSEGYEFIAGRPLLPMDLRGQHLRSSRLPSAGIQRSRFHNNRAGYER